MTMGTASTMACLAETLGMQLPGSAAWPAADARRGQTAQLAGQRIVALARTDLRPSPDHDQAGVRERDRGERGHRRIDQRGHPPAGDRGPRGVPLALDDFDSLARPVPTLVNLMPSGRYLMEDFCYAGGVPAVMRELGDLLHTDHVTVTGQTLAENIATAECWNREVIKTVTEPLQPPGTGTAVLRGNLCPDGAVIKQSAASPHLLKHRGQALVFDSIEEYHRAAVDPDLAVPSRTSWSSAARARAGTRACRRSATSCCRPAAAARRDRHGPHLRRPDERDRVRDGRAARGAGGGGRRPAGPDPHRRLGGAGRAGPHADPGCAGGRAGPAPPCLAAARAGLQRGYARLYVEHVQQADKGADLDFLVGASGAQVPRDNH